MDNLVTKDFCETNKGFTKLCPQCKFTQSYCSKSAFKKAIKNNTICYTCCNKNKTQFFIDILERKCPKCNNIIIYSSKYSFIDSTKNNSLCRSCSKKGKRNKINRNKGKYSDSVNKLISGGIIWENENNIWCRKCPTCNDVVEHITPHGRGNCIRSVKKNKICSNCRINKSNEVLRNYYKENKHPWMGRKHTEESKEKNRRSKLGQILSLETRKKISEKNKGRPSIIKGTKLPELWYQRVIKANNNQSEENKRKKRIAAIERYNRLGYTSIDDGAFEWFKIMRDIGYNFIETWRCKDLGYIADGYEPKKHIWMEYDTPYHIYPKQKEKDLIRQKNIIKYFENIGNPLNQFVRVDMTKPERPAIEVVYRGIKNINN